MTDGGICFFWGPGTGLWAGGIDVKQEGRRAVWMQRRTNDQCGREDENAVRTSKHLQAKEEKKPETQGKEAGGGEKWIGLGQRQTRCN